MPRASKKLKPRKKPQLDQDLCIEPSNPTTAAAAATIEDDNWSSIISDNPIDLPSPTPRPPKHHKWKYFSTASNLDGHVFAIDDKDFGGQMGSEVEVIHDNVYNMSDQEMDKFLIKVPEWQIEFPRLMKPSETSMPDGPCSETSIPDAPRSDLDESKEGDDIWSWIISEYLTDQVEVFHDNVYNMSQEMDKFLIKVPEGQIEFPRLMKPSGTSMPDGPCSQTSIPDAPRSDLDESKEDVMIDLGTEGHDLMTNGNVGQGRSSPVGENSSGRHDNNAGEERG